MFDNPKFAKLAASGAPTGEVVAANRFMITVNGLGEVGPGMLIYFETGDQGMVRDVQATESIVLSLTSERIPQGTLAVVESPELATGVGDVLLGRVVSPLGQPLDDGGPITFAEHRPTFSPAHSIIERKMLDTALPTGITIIDMLFPLVLGQRIAVLGDNKVGKSTLLSQLTRAQAGTKRIVVHVLIAKRKADVDQLLNRLKSSGALAYSIVVVASILDPLPQAYLAPYAGAAMAEFLWHQGRDVIVLYDDLTNHAKVHRELSLLLNTPPGRDSYPGDMFFAHSSLLERSGRLASNGATLTAVPIMLAPNDDITAYLPTSVMSITDGQLIMDSATFKEGIRPAVNFGLSVSRVGGRGQTARQKHLTSSLSKSLAAYRQALELSHFGSELALESQNQLGLGRQLYEGLKQAPDVIYTAMEQVLIVETILKTEGKTVLNIDNLKRQVKTIARKVKADGEIDQAVSQLLAASTVNPAPAPAPAVPVPAAPAPETGGKS